MSRTPQVIDDDAIEIGRLYGLAKSSAVDSVIHAIDCGNRLKDKKRRIGHGAWLPWLEANDAILGFSNARTAQKLISFSNKANAPSTAHLEEADALRLSRELWGNKDKSEKTEERERANAETRARNTRLPKGKYAAIYADPPWSFQVWSGEGKDRAAENHYPTMDLNEIKSLPVADIAADDCALFLWACCPQLPEALEVIETWGFDYKTVGFVWIKQTKDASGLAWGMGYWTRANAELCLIATRGKPKRLYADVHQVIEYPRMEHSVKPIETAERIERLVAGPYIELFSRSPRDGWDAWGNQV